LIHITHEDNPLVGAGKMIVKTEQLFFFPSLKLVQSGDMTQMEIAEGGYTHLAFSK